MRAIVHRCIASMALHYHKRPSRTLPVLAKRTITISSEVGSPLRLRVPKINKGFTPWHNGRRGRGLAYLLSNRVHYFNVNNVTRPWVTNGSSCYYLHGDGWELMRRIFEHELGVRIPYVSAVHRGEYYSSALYRKYMK